MTDGELAAHYCNQNAVKADMVRHAILAKSGLPQEAHAETTPGVHPTDQPVYNKNLAAQSRLAALLRPLVAKRCQAYEQTHAVLKARYIELSDAWNGSLARRERERDNRI